MRAVERMGWGGWEIAYVAYLLEAFSPRLKNDYAGF